ncbi:MAG: SRPBCC family protein [Kribbellaceae bacterium]
MAIEGNTLVHEIRIQASPATVFAYFTDEARHVRWLGRQATLDPRPGGLYRCVVNDMATLLGEYVVVDPPHRVVFTWGFAGNQAIPPGTSTVAVTLTPTGSGTLLTLVHTGLPHPALDAHHTGWQGYLHQLARELTAAPAD